MIIDTDLELLQQLVLVLDKQLENIIAESREVEDPDGFGYYDIAEHIIGLGFVACQTYMSSVYGYLQIDKKKAISFGPVHSCGQTKMQLINHAANYWKHNNEWPHGKFDKQRKAIEEAFKDIGFPVGRDYPLSNILTEVVSPKTISFSPIIEMLELWRNELYTKFQTKKD